MTQEKHDGKGGDHYYSPGRAGGKKIRITMKGVESTQPRKRGIPKRQAGPREKRAPQKGRPIFKSKEKDFENPGRDIRLKGQKFTAPVGKKSW